MKVPTHDELLGALEAYEVAVQEDANEGGDEAAEGLGTAREHLIGVLKACAATRTTQEPVATLLCCDPEDERAGFWLSLEDKQRLGKLPAGTKLYAALTAQDNAKARLQAIREIYNGMEGFEPKTAPEDYLLRIVRQMYHAAIHEDGK